MQGSELPPWRSCGSAELEYEAADQSWIVLMEKRWRKRRGQGHCYSETAGPCGNGDVRE